MIKTGTVLGFRAWDARMSGMRAWTRVREILQGVMHGIGIIWHLTIHLSMTPYGLETDPQTSNVHAFAYGHESSTTQNVNYARPVSGIYFQLKLSVVVIVTQLVGFRVNLSY